MAYARISAGTITVPNFSNLLASWRSYDRRARALIGHYIVERPLTESQRRRLPAELRERLA